MEVGAKDVQGLPLLAKPAPRQSYAPMAGKPAPSSHEPRRQWSQALVTRIYISGKIKEGRGGGKSTIQIKTLSLQDVLIGLFSICLPCEAGNVGHHMSGQDNFAKTTSNNTVGSKADKQTPNIKWQPTNGSTFLQTTWIAILSDYSPFNPSLRRTSCYLCVFRP